MYIYIRGKCIGKKCVKAFCGGSDLKERAIDCRHGRRVGCLVLKSDRLSEEEIKIMSVYQLTVSLLRACDFRLVTLFVINIIIIFLRQRPLSPSVFPEKIFDRTVFALVRRP